MVFSINDLINVGCFKSTIYTFTSQSWNFLLLELLKEIFPTTSNSHKAQNSFFPRYSILYQISKNNDFNTLKKLQNFEFDETVNRFLYIQPISNMLPSFQYTSRTPIRQKGFQCDFKCKKKSHARWIFKRFSNHLSYYVHK